MKALSPGQKVRLVQHVIEGEVVRPDTNGEEFGYQVRYKGEDGETHERFFSAARLLQLKPEEPAEVPVEGEVQPGEVQK